MNRIINQNGKTYRITALTQVNDTPSCVAEFLYKGKWHEVKNYNICADLRRIYDKEIAQ